MANESVIVSCRTLSAKEESLEELNALCHILEHLEKLDQRSFNLLNILVPILDFVEYALGIANTI